jgi:hypothetical protein
MLNPSKPIVIDATEKFVNSGIIVAKQFMDKFPGSTESFTVTFKKQGTYYYICIIILHGRSNSSKITRIPIFFLFLDRY